jgi:hypothetical protein
MHGTCVKINDKQCVFSQVFFLNMIYMDLMLQRITDLHESILYVRVLDTTQNTSRLKESASFTHFLLSFLVWPLLLTRCRRIWLFWHLITFNDTHLVGLPWTEIGRSETST